MAEAQVSETHAATPAAAAPIDFRSLGRAAWPGLVVAALLLAWEHTLVAPDDLSRVNVAFFTLNGWVGVALFAGLVADLALGGGLELGGTA